MDLINRFQLFVMALTPVDAWWALGGVLVLFVLGNMMASRFASPAKAKRVVEVVLAVIGYSVLALLLLNALLTRNYDRLAITVFVMLLPALKRWIGKLYSRYDKAVDRMAGK